jgi:hypothetical protein
VVIDGARYSVEASTTSSFRVSSALLRKLEDLGLSLPADRSKSLLSQPQPWHPLRLLLQLTVSVVVTSLPHKGARRADRSQY